MPVYKHTQCYYTAHPISTEDLAKRVTPCKHVPFAGANDVPVNFGSQTPKTQNIAPMNGTLKREQQKLYCYTGHDKIFTWDSHYSHYFPQQIQNGGQRPYGIPQNANITVLD